MATTANKNCKQFIGIVTGEDGITARSGDEPGKGTVKLKTAEINESESTSSETVYQISETGSTDVEVFNQSNMTFSIGEEVQIWQDGYGVFWVTPNAKRETFLIKYSNSPSASDYAKGNMEYIIWSVDDNAWIPVVSFDNLNIGKVRLAVCQEDLPSDLSSDYLMPYYPLEDNIGVAPNKSTASGELFTDRCGVAPGEHVLSNKRFDYCFKYGRYAYEPKFVLQTYAEAHTSGNTGVYVTINGVQYPVEFPSGVGSSFPTMQMAPDVYDGDSIAVQVESNLRYPNNTHVFALSYPVDFAENYVMIDVGNSFLGGRGWDDVTTDYIPTNNPDLNYSESLMVVKHWGNSSVLNSCASADAQQQFGILELGLKFYKKVKTDALI